MILVNFGGPRDLAEVPSFLTELLTDQEVIRTRWPRGVHRWLFRRVAHKRAQKVTPEYAKIGGGSPLFRDTEEMARCLSEKLSIPVLTFHRYLVATHEQSLRAIEASGEKMLRVVPLFPQFSYATTGSIAKFFAERLSKQRERSLCWIPSYPTHPAFIGCYAECIRTFLQNHHLEEGEVALLFSCHGLPRAFVEAGDVYESECQRSFAAIAERFPKAVSQLAYQSKFGRGEWLRPYTEEMCRSPECWVQARKAVVIVPLSFTSDHIETLYEIEQLYVSALRTKGLFAGRCSAINLASGWIDGLVEIASGPTVVANGMLLRK